MGLSTLGAQEPVPGYRQKMALCSHLGYQICKCVDRVFSLTWPAYMQIYWNKRKSLHKKRVQLPEDWFGTPTWPPFHCFGTPIWPPWRHVKTLYSYSGDFAALLDATLKHELNSKYKAVDCPRTNKNGVAHRDPVIIIVPYPLHSGTDTVPEY